MKPLRDAEKVKTQAREILKRVESRQSQKPLSKQQMEQMIGRIRKTREELWEERLAARH